MKNSLKQIWNWYVDFFVKGYAAWLSIFCLFLLYFTNNPIVWVIGIANAIPCIVYGTWDLFQFFKQNAQRNM